MNVLASSSTTPLRASLGRTGRSIGSVRSVSDRARSAELWGPLLAPLSWSTLTTDATFIRTTGGYRLSKTSNMIDMKYRLPLQHSSLPSRRSISTSTTSLLYSTIPIHLPPTTTAPTRPPASSTSPASLSPDPTPRNPSGSEQEFEPEPSEDPNAPPQSAMARLKILFKRYGWYALGMYTVLSALDFSLTFALIHLAGLERMEPLIRAAVQQYRVIRFGADQAGEMKMEDERKRSEEKKGEERKQGGRKEKSSGWISKTVLAEMALAYPIHKIVLLPVRAGLTVAWTPKFVGWLTRRGWVGKGGYTRAATHAQDKIRTAKERVKERVKDIRE